MSIQRVVFVLVVIALAMKSCAARDCNFLINGRLQRYRHGETFTLPQSRCQVHRCDDGRDSIMKQGCDFEGQCRNIGSSFVGTSCATYTCTMPFGNYFMVKPIRGGCKDYYNRCHQPGDTFPYVMRGRYYSRCKCQVLGAQTYYECQG